MADFNLNLNEQNSESHVANDVTLAMQRNNNVHSRNVKKPSVAEWVENVSNRYYSDVNIKSCEHFDDTCTSDESIAEDRVTDDLDYLYHPKLEQDTSRPTMRGTMTCEDVSAKLPSSHGSSGNAQKLLKCSYMDCTRNGTIQAVGYCLDHLTELINNGEMDIPTKRDVTNFEKTLGITDNIRSTIREQTFAREKRILSANTRSARTSRPQDYQRMRTTVDSSDKERAALTQHQHRGAKPKTLSKGKDKICCRGKHRSCANSNCNGEGLKTYGGLCIDCYNTILDENAKDIELPKPDRVVMPMNSKQSCCDNKHRRKSRCQFCGHVIEGGCFCSHCEIKSTACKKSVKTQVNSSSRPAQFSANPSSSLHNFRNFDFRDVFEDGPEVSCDVTGFLSEKSCDVTRGEGDCGHGVSLVSQQPSLDDQGYTMCVGDLDFHYNSRTYFPSDRG